MKPRHLRIAITLSVFPGGPAVVAGAPVAVTSETALKAALRRPPAVMRIAGIVRITGPVMIPDGTMLDFSAGGTLQKAHPSARLKIDGPVTAGRVQIFANGDEGKGMEWLPGEISGRMGGESRLPEWWGARAGLSESLGTANARALNCAIRSDYESGSLAATQMPVRVVLAGGTFPVAGPVNMSNTGAVLEGQGAAATILHAVPSPDWDRDRISDSFFPDGHTAMIWSGSTTDLADITPSGETFSSHGCSVRGLSLEGSPAIRALSGISARGGTVPDSRLLIAARLPGRTTFEDLRITGFSACGIGFDRLVIADNLRITGCFLEADRTDTRSIPACGIRARGGLLSISSCEVKGDGAGEGIVPLSGTFDIRACRISDWIRGIAVPEADQETSVSLSAIDVYQWTGPGTSPVALWIETETAQVSVHSLSCNGGSGLVISDEEFDVRLAVNGSERIPGSHTCRIALYSRGYSATRGMRARQKVGPVF